MRGYRTVLGVLAGVAALVAAAYVAGYLLTGDRLPHGTRIGGVEVGGLSTKAATAKLADSLDATRTLTVEAGGKQATIDPVAAGLTADPTESVRRAHPGRSWDPRRMWDHLVGGRSYAVVDGFDDTRLGQAIDQVATALGTPLVDGAITFGADGQAKPVYPTPGRAVDKVALQAAVLAAFPAEATVTARLVEVPPTVTADEVSRAMQEIAGPALSGPVVLTVSGQQVSVSPSGYATALSTTATGGRLSLGIDKDRLGQVVGPLLAPLLQGPQDATVRLVAGTPQVVPSAEGVTYDADALATGFVQAVTASGDARTVAVTTRAAAPAVTTEQATAWGIKELVSDFVTYYPQGSTYRDVNQGIAASTINGTVLEPGDTFSLNGVLGERTLAKGYVEGGVIEDGTSAHAVGGGISQVATTTFNAMFFAGLKDVTHKPHSYYISRYPEGREATVNWDNVDLKFTNDTPYGVLIEAWRVPSVGRKGELHVRMWSTKHWDIQTKKSARYAITAPKTRTLSGPACEPVSETASGFQVDVWRYFYKPGSTVLDHQEKFHTTYIPIDRVTCS